MQIIGSSPVALTATDANGNPIAFAANGQVLSLGALIDAIQTTYTNLWLLLWAHSTTGIVPHFSIIVSALLVGVTLAVVVFICLGFYLLAKVELALCLAVGPVFILLAIFEPTREWTRRWIGQLWHYGIQIGLMAACISMLQGTLVFFANGATNNYPITAVRPYSRMCSCWYSCPSACASSFGTLADLRPRCLVPLAPAMLARLGVPVKRPGRRPHGGLKRAGAR